METSDDDTSSLFGRGVPHRLPYTETSAVFSDCGAYRYLLSRTWDDSLERITWIGLNPSVADADQDDRTIGRIVDFSNRWGFGGLDMLNAFAFRSTFPKQMQAAADPVGPENDAFIQRYCAAPRTVVAAWGVGGAFAGRHGDLVALLPNLECLTKTKHGFPGHPLYVRGDAERISLAL